MIKFFCIAMLIFGVADFLGVKTKSLLSGPFVILLSFLVLFLTGVLPLDIIDQAGMTKAASLSIYLLMTDMGTMINLKEIKREWRTVILASLSVVFSAIGILALIPIIGKDSALVSLPIVNGALQASIIMLNAASEKNLILAYALGAMVYATQKFFGTVPASFCGRKFAAKLVTEYRENKANGIDLNVSESEGEAKKTFYEKHKKFYTSNVLIFAIALLAFISWWLGDKTGINYTIYCLILGCVARNTGILPEKPMTVAKCAGFLNMACFANLIPALAKVTVPDLVANIAPLFMVFGATLLAIFIFVRLIPGWKIVGDKNLAYGICMSQMLGFPATMLVSNEIVTSFAENEDEAKYLEKKISIPYVLAGLVAATVLSVVVASFCAKMLG